jgi:hypothetical protein
MNALATGIDMAIPGREQTPRIHFYGRLSFLKGFVP